MKTTDYLELVLPDFENTANIEDINSNMDKIDLFVKELNDRVVEMEESGAQQEEIEQIKDRINILEEAKVTLDSKIDTHINNKENPHNVTKQQVGLGKVNNTSDLDKPVSTAVKKELEGIKELIDLKIDEIPDVFHDLEQNAVKEEMTPGEFEYGVTLCSQSLITDFPTINEYGVSYTIIGKHSNYVQLFITRFGDIWSRRSSAGSSWDGEWYNSKKNIDDLYNKIDILNKNTGDLSQLKTRHKTDLVGAINEIVDINQHKVYGVEVDETNLNPETAVTYIADAVGMTPAKQGDYGSWESWLKHISYRVVVKNGKEQYKLDYDDPSKTISGEDAVITGEDGDIFTKFKHLYRRFEKTNKGYRLYVSHAPFTGAISYTTMLEDGYNQLTNASMVMLQDLYLITHKNRDSQTALGRGYVDVTSSDPFASTGGTNGKGYLYGEATGKQQMCFLGIEDMWGNKYQWVDGLVSDSSYNLLIGYKNFNDSGSNYKKITTSTSSSLSGYAKTVQGGEAGYVLADKDASSSTGYCDYGYLYSGKVACFGGVRSYGSNAGTFSVGLYYSASTSIANIGSRLCFKNENGVYIGNYLGFEQSGKLRSIAGKESTESKTIGAFRTLTQANN